MLTTFFSRAALLATAAAFAASPIASAQECTDADSIVNEAPTGFSFSVGVTSASRAGQSFVAPCDGSITSVGFSSNGDIAGTYFIYAGAGNGGALLASGPYEIDAAPRVIQSVPVDPVAVSAGSAYTIYVGSEESYQVSVTPDQYPDGSFYIDNEPRADFEGEPIDLVFSVGFAGEDGGGEEGPSVSDASIEYGSCSPTLPAGRSRCRVEVSATLDADQGQRYTVFLRLSNDEGFSRIVTRGEAKPRPGQTITRRLPFRTKRSDPSGPLTLEFVVEEGSVAEPGADAVVLDMLAFTKGGAGLRAANGLSVSPNPAVGAAAFRFAVPERAEATLVVYDALGREVARPIDGAVRGEVEAQFDASALSAGVYVARLVVGGHAEAIRFSVVR